MAKKIFQEKNSSRPQRRARAKTLWQRNQTAPENPASSEMNTERKRKHRLQNEPSSFNIKYSGYFLENNGNHK